MLHQNMTDLRHGGSGWLLLLMGLWCGYAWGAQSTDENDRLVIPDINALEDYHVLPASPALSQTLIDAAEYVLRWKLPQDPASALARRSEVDRALRKAIGLERLPERTPLNFRVLRSHDMGDYTLENVLFYSRPDCPVPANLYRPKGPATARRPAVVCPLGHSLDQGKADREYQIFCIQLAKLGFVVLTYDAIGHGERLISGNIHHEAGFALLPLGQTIAGWMIWDSMRAIDAVQSLPDVDPERIGVTGNSGGGLNTLFTAALDPRVRAATIAGYVFHFNNWIKYAGSHCTCCYLPGLYRSMEWYEVAGLIAPRAVLMLQGERDAIFPISGARLAGRNTEALFSLLGHQGQARFDGIPEQPHAYSRPYRERMYGWMLRHLMDRGNGEPYPEGQIVPLDQKDRRLLCDPDGTNLAAMPSVVQLARTQGRQAIESLTKQEPQAVRNAGRLAVRELTVPPYQEPHHLLERSFGKIETPSGPIEKVFFLSEDGQPIPGLLWKPHNAAGPSRTVIMVDDRGKSAVADSGLVQPLLARGLAVLSVDLRGRGETLGQSGTRFDNNFHLAVHSVMWGRPLAGRRAFDLKRTVDFVEIRGDLTLNDLTAVGLGDDALPTLLAAAGDPRIQRVACAGFYSSFVSQMVPAKLTSRTDLVRAWNSNAMNWGRLDTGPFKVDLGSVIPSILLAADVPDLASLLFPRKLLFCQARDHQEPLAEQHESRFRQVLATVSPHPGDWARYAPDQPLSADQLIEWLNSR
ncbi:MAG: acetylxylan esterase [Acidobacteriota bacterium]